MKSIMLATVLAVVLALTTSVAVSAATNIFGLSGGLELSTDRVLNPGQISVGYTHGFNVADQDINFFDGVVGLAPGFEVGIGFVDPDESDNAFLLNAKYRFLAESATRPAVTVGVVDAASDLDINNEDDPSFFILVSKTLTRWVENVTEEESKPIRGHIGFGSGVYDGLLLGLDWVLTPTLQASFEYIGGGLNDNDFNGLLRWAATKDIRLDVGTIDFDSLTLGINYTTAKF